ncbi:MAG: hydrogenase small subunit [Bacillota bacterium]
MIPKDQFEDFCRLYKNRPDFGVRLMDFMGADALIPAEKARLIWLEANACSGDSISMLNAVKPDLRQILCAMLDVRYWNALMPDEGERAVEKLFSAAEQGGFILAVEGAIPARSQGRYAFIFKYGRRAFTAEETLHYLAERAGHIVSVGTCAAFGGPSAARPNPSGSRGVWEVVREPVVNVSGCPINPDWLLGTLLHLMLYGAPKTDRYGRPALFYGQTIHSNCQRRSYFDTGSFAKRLGAPECMFSLGCMGPITGSDCPYRMWNDHLNWPVKAGTPCIGCTKAGFPDKSTPYYAPLSQKIPVREKSAERQA